MREPYIFTEIVNCGKIGKIAILSFHKYHKHKVFIYGTKEDFKWIDKNENNVFIEVDDKIISAYQHGHIGTATLWERIIKENDYDNFIHFDSDVIFRENVIDELIEKSKEYDLIGPVRCYQNNPQGIREIRNLTDICQTNCTLFKKSFISKKYLNNEFSFFRFGDILNMSLKQIARRVKWHIKNILLSKNKLSRFAQMINGTYNPFNFPTIDFFDPIMFDMILNGAKIYHLDFDEVGGCNKYGNRNNKYRDLNNFPTPYKLDYGSKLVHFSCVGSGMNFYNNKKAAKNVDKTYVDCALDRYALFCKVFYDENLPGHDLGKYKDLFIIKDCY